MRWLGLACFSAAAAFGFFGALPGQRRWLAFLLGAAVLPLLMLWLPSVAGKPLYSDRAMLFCALAWVALAAFGLSRLPAVAAWVALAFLLGLQLAALWQHYFDPSVRRPDSRPAWNYVLSKWQTGDTIFHQRDTETYYPFKFFALQEQHRGQSPYQDETGAAFFEGSARVKGLRPNWVYMEQPDAFNPSASAGFFRRVWRSINAWLTLHGYGIYAGFNRDQVDGLRVRSEALPGVQRIWYLSWVQDAGRRIWLPQMNGAAAGVNLVTPFDPDKIPWLKGFKLLEEQTVGDVIVRLYEAPKASKGSR
jgi:hypothetical protein